MKNQIKHFLNQYYAESELNDDENLVASGAFNSLFAMQLVMFLEKEFNIKLDSADIDINNFSTINNIVKMVESKK